VGIGGAFRRRLCRAPSSVGIEAGLLHLFFRPALQFLNGAGDRPEFVGLAMGKDGRSREHADGLTRNVLIPFRDGSYLELVAFLDPDDPRDNVWGWRPFLSSGGGLIDYCAACDDLPTDARGSRSVASVWTVPSTAGGSSSTGRDSVAQRPDTPRQSARALFDRGHHPSSLRVPGGRSAEHANGATGISRLEIAAPEAKAAVGDFAILLGSPAGFAVSLRLGSCTLSLTGQRDEAR
jgi:hypothetical protein